jgi:hypothetical protein
MAISDAQFTAWLSNGAAVRCILVEAVASVSSVETTRYMSTRAYFDSAVGRVYEPIIVGNSVRIVERLSLDGESTLNYGDIEIQNIDGSRDSWLDDIWTNRSVSAYIGDVTWGRSDFRPIFVGVTEDIDSKDNTTLNIKIRDKLARLNTPVTEQTLGGTTPNKNELMPLCFGECHNVTPLLADPATLDYRVHDGRIENIIEMRSNGVPGTFTETLASGKFVPDVNPQGTKITVDVQGDNDDGASYLTTAKEIIEDLVLFFGEVNNRFTSGDLDSSNLSAFDAANQQKLGIYLNRREVVKSLCDEIAASVGAQMVMSREGKLQLHKIDLPPPGTPIDITTSDIIENTLSISERIPVTAAVKIGYAKNWTVQDSLDTGIPQKHKDSFAKEWWTVTSEDSTTKTNYRLDAEPSRIDTFLIEESDASAEATRRLTLFKTQRHIISFSAIPRLIELQLGDAVTITHPRFGLSGGKTGMVVGMSVDWQNLIVDMEVFL